MDLDEDICLCFHVTLRKVKKFIRLEKPVRASQISQCYGAGTGCGWCRPFLEKLMADSQNNTAESIANPSANPDTDSNADSIADSNRNTSLDSLTPQQYAKERKSYVDQGRGTPPSA